MDPLSISASIAALIDVTKGLIHFALDFAEAPDHIQKLKESLEDLESLLKRLMHRCASAPSDAPWLQGLYQVQSLEVDGKLIDRKKGVLVALKQIIDKLSTKLNPSRQWKKKEAWQRLTWHLKKESVNEIQADITRYLVVINNLFTLKNDETSSEILHRLSIFELNQRQENERRQRDRDEDERAEIISWLSPFSFRAKEEELFKECFNETGDWLLQDQRFRFWAEEGHLWYLECIGKPMVGKTVLSSILIHYLRSRMEAPLILSLYLEYKAATVQTIPNLMMSLLKQIFQHDERPIPDELKRLYKKVKGLELTPTSYDNHVRKILMSELDRYDQFYVVVDGFDELQLRDRLRRELRKLHPGKSSLLFMTRGKIDNDDKVVVCDRCNEQDVKIYLKCRICNSGDYDLCLDCQRKGLWCDDPTHELSNPYVRSQIEVRIPDQDIERYVRHEIGVEMTDIDPIPMDERFMGADPPDMTRFQGLCQSDPTLPERIVSTIVEKADGRFLFARLYLDLLRKALNPKMMRKILANFPEDINDIYKESMHRIEKQDKEDRFRALKILGLITRVRRPLSMKELQHALAAMEFGDDDEELAEKDIVDATTRVNLILEITSGLVITEDNGHSKDVKLVHRSLEEYLQTEESQLAWFPKADLEIARACLQYLSICIPHGARGDEYWVSKTNEYPFLRYASQYWGDHVHDAKHVMGSDSALQTMVMQLINDSQRMNACMQVAWATNLGGHDTWDVRRQVNRLHVCAWYGLSSTIAALEPDKSTVDVIEPKYGQTPLMYACRRGHSDTVRQLLELGASLRKVSTKGRTAMFEAVLHQHDEVVEVLAELEPPDLDINAVNPKEFHRTALMLAARSGWIEIVYTLLRYPGVNINLQDVNGMTALYLAAKYDHPQIVESLLEAGASVDIGDYKVGRSALRVAAERNHIEIVDKLLEYRAQIDMKDFLGGTPILHAVQQGAEDTFNRMMEVGGYLQVVDEDGQSLLHIASEYDRFSIAHKLIEEGLDPNIRDNCERTPLHIASQHGKATTLSLLLEKNADLNLKDQYGRTPKFVAWQYGQSQIRSLLEKFEKDQLARRPQELPDNAQLPIWSMAKQGLAEHLALAIKTRQDDPDTVEPFSKYTALHCAIDANEPDILLLLLDTGTVPIDAPNRWQRTPLHFAALVGDLNATELLVSRDADLECKDRWGDEPLVLAQSNWHNDVMMALIVAGASVDRQKIDLEKLFFVAVEGGNVGAVQALLNEGVDRSVQNAEGLRALQIATALSDEAMSQVLRRAPTVLFGAAEVDESGTGSRGVGNELVGPPARVARSTPFRSRPGQL